MLAQGQAVVIGINVRQGQSSRQVVRDLEVSISTIRRYRRERRLGLRFSNAAHHASTVVAEGLRATDLHSPLLAIANSVIPTRSSTSLLSC